MPPEDHKTQKKIQCWIPLETWDKIVSLGYTSPTIAVTKAFEKLLEGHREDSLHISNGSPIDPQESPIDPSEIHLRSPYIPEGSPEIPELKAVTEEQKVRIEEYKAQLQSLNAEISRLKTIVMEAPDPVDLVRLQERNDGLNLLLGEKEKRIIELTQYKEDIGAFANYFKSKSPELIEAPAAEKKKAWWKFW